MGPVFGDIVQGKSSGIGENKRWDSVGRGSGCADVFTESVSIGSRSRCHNLRGMLCGREREFNFVTGRLSRFPRNPELKIPRTALTFSQSLCVQACCGTSTIILRACRAASCIAALREKTAVVGTEYGVFTYHSECLPI